jgi:hypothetical protein
LLLAALRLVLAGAAAGDAYYRILNLSETPAPSREPALADAATGTWIIVAWEESGSEIMTRGVSDMVLPPVHHGPGRDPALGSVMGRVYLAFARDDAIVIREWLDPDWSAPLVITTGSGFPAARPEFGVRYDTADEPVYLVWCEERRSLEVDIWFTELAGGSWRTPVRIVERIPGQSEFVCAEVEPAGPTGAERPRVYWFANGFELRYSERSGGEWSAPLALYGFGVQMEVAAGPDGLHHILANGPQPTCPCNVMLYVAETPDGFTDPEDISVPLDDYTWPQHPALRVDGRGVVHAFWYESAWDFMLQFSGEAMFYCTRTGNVWEDESWLLDMHVGIDNALAVRGYPLFSWVERNAGNDEVFAGFPDLDLGVDSGSAVPVSPRAITASPNPFAVTTRIAVAGIEDARPHLDVVDVRGRRVAGLSLATGGGGPATATWDGRDARGRPCPAGTYWLVLPTANGRHVSPVTLLR